MAYLLIATAFALWLLFACSVILATRRVPALSSFRPYAWRSTLWATIGIVIANGLWATIVALWSPTIGRLHLSVFAGHNDAQLLFGVLAIAGVVAASILGLVAGMIFGMALAYRHTRLPPNNSFKGKPLRGSP